MAMAGPEAAARFRRHFPSPPPPVLDTLQVCYACKFMSAQERLRRAASGSAAEVKVLVHDPSEEVLLALLDNPAFNEDHLKVLLARASLTVKVLREIASRE